MKSIVKSKRQVPYKQKKGGGVSGWVFGGCWVVGTSIEVANRIAWRHGRHA